MTVQTDLTRGQAWVDIILMLGLIIATTFALSTLTVLFLGEIKLPVILVVQGMVVLLAIHILLRHRGQRWIDVGLRTFRSADLSRAGVALLSCLAANFVFSSMGLLFHPERLQQHVESLKYISGLLAELPFSGLVAMLMFVGVYEELAARGFLLTRCRIGLAGSWAPILVSSLLFGLGHMYQGLIGVIQTTLIGIILATFTVRWGTLWPAILAHTALDTLSILIIKNLPMWPSTPGATASPFIP